LYRAFNVVRVVEGRMHEAYLRVATRRTAPFLMGLQLAVVVAWWAWNRWHGDGSWLWYILTALQCFAGLVFLLSIRRRLSHTAWPTRLAAMSDDELPTISVAIPARNETEDLQQCLETLIASDYPKLEILVLDDCSQNKRTPEIIRGFAHDGVRFIQGDEPSDVWLAKNQAYERLATEASGDFILFCGVDVRFSSQSLRDLATVMVSKHKEMLSLLPRRDDTAGVAFAQAMRYWWELAPPRRLFLRPPVLSTCWIISRKMLEKSGGFKAVARSITPEAYFAKRATQDDAYSFMRSSVALGIASMKTSSEQRATAVRVRYPQLHRRPESVAVVSLAELAFLVVPFIVAIIGFWVHIGIVPHILAIVASLLLIAAYTSIARTTHTVPTPVSLVVFPLGILFSIGLLHYSMWRYEFSTVEWKGRNVCVPAMHVIPHLPKID